MVTVTKLANLDVGGLENAARDWGAIASALLRNRDGLGTNVVDVLADKWKDDAGDAAARVCKNIKLDMKAVATEVRAVERFLEDVANGSGDGFGSLRQHQQNLHQLQHEVIGQGMSMADDGRVNWAEFRAPGPVTPAEKQHFDEKTAVAAGFEQRAKEILKAATSIDDSLTRGLSVIFGDEDTFRTEQRGRHAKGADLGDGMTVGKLDLVFQYLSLKGWNDAATLLDHYLDGGGEPVNIDANRLLNDSPTFKQDVDASLGDVRRLPDGQFITPWKGSSSPASQNLNWYYALNNFEYRLVGEKHGGTITYHVDVAKRYDWGIPSEHRRSLDEGPIHLEQSDIARLNMVGMGKDFDVHGATHTMTSR
jgi:hypothetical protein